MTRCLRLRTALNWTQDRLAAYLGLAQSAVARMEAGQRETGPVSRLLDLLDAQVSSPGPNTPAVAVVARHTTASAEAASPAEAALAEAEA